MAWAQKKTNVFLFPVGPSAAKLFPFFDSILFYFMAIIAIENLVNDL